MYMHASLTNREPQSAQISCPIYSSWDFNIGSQGAGGKVPLNRQTWPLIRNKIGVVQLMSCPDLARDVGVEM